jgi:hypothetical protein
VKALTSCEMEDLVSVPRFGEIVAAWHIQGLGERVAVIEERARMDHWWVVYRRVQDRWVQMGAFHSVESLVLHTAPRYAEVVDVALPVNPRQANWLVVEEDERFLYWVVHGSIGNWTGILVTYSAYKNSFVVPI